MNSVILKELEDIQKDILVTIYLPVLPGPQNTYTNISALHHANSVLKTMLNDADIPKSNDADIPKSNHEDILSNVADLEKELGHPISGKSLAILIDIRNQVLAYEVPFYIEGTIYVLAPSLQFGPLKAKYNEHLRYWVLNLSQHGCKLFRGDKLEIEEVQDKELAKDIATKLRLDLTETMHQQSHSVNSPGARASESYNGQGGYKDHKKKYLEDYLRLMDKQLTKHIAKPSEPIILVGVDYVQAMYKKVSAHKNVLASKHALSHNSPTLANIRSLVTPILPELATA